MRDKKTVIIRMIGGLGNQMYCYAFYKKMSTEYPNIKFLLDISDVWEKQYVRKVELLDVFPNIEIECATPYQIFKAQNKLTFKYRGKGSRYLKKIVNKINSQIMPYKKKYCITETEYNDNDSGLNWENIRYFDGYWQNIDYYLLYLDELKKDFTFCLTENDKVIKAMAEIQECNSVSVHIRRGDYVGESLDILNTDYYKSLIDKIKRENTDAHFYFFSNDIPFVEREYEWLKEKTIIDFNTGKDSYRDMQLMSLCKTNIIANSTFSIWAALLNRSDSCTIYYPSHYYKGIEMQDIRLPYFVKVNCLDID